MGSSGSVRREGQSVEGSCTPIVGQLGAFPVPEVSQANWQKGTSVEAAELSWLPPNLGSHPENICHL